MTVHLIEGPTQHVLRDAHTVYLFGSYTPLRDMDETGRVTELASSLGPTRQANDAASGPSSGSRCMTKGTEESLTRRLEKQYEAAMDCSRNKRGLGLGYNPDEDPNNKTFYIDKTASKSVKL